MKNGIKRALELANTEVENLFKLKSDFCEMTKSKGFEYAKDKLADSLINQVSKVSTMLIMLNAFTGKKYSYDKNGVKELRGK